MRYVRRVLLPGEVVVYATRLHWLIYARAVVLLVCCLILAGAGAFAGVGPNSQLALYIAAAIFAALALSSGLRAWVRRVTTELAVSDQRVIYKTGLISRHTLEMNRTKVESVDVDQTILGRVFGYGTIVVRGTGGSLEPIRNIEHPLVFRSHITAAAAPTPFPG